MPLGHLIALINNAHPPTPNRTASEKAVFPGQGLGRVRIVERPEFYRDKPDGSCGCKLLTLAGDVDGRPASQANLLLTMVMITAGRCRSGFVFSSLVDTIERGGARRDRTDDLKLAKLALSQLS